MAQETEGTYMSRAHHCAFCKRPTGGKLEDETHYIYICNCCRQDVAKAKSREGN